MTPKKLRERPPAVASWRDQIERLSEHLSEHASPCRYLILARCTAIHASALAFVDRFGAAAHRLGWTTEQRLLETPRVPGRIWLTIPSTRSRVDDSTAE